VFVLRSLWTVGVCGDSGDRYEHAAVPGSSDPSGQSQKSSLSWEIGILMDGFEIHVKLSGDL